jgi:hypothetical protein
VLILGLVHINGLLEIEPELSAIAEYRSKPERHIRCDGLLFVNYQVNRTAGSSKQFGKARLRNVSGG